MNMNMANNSNSMNMNIGMNPNVNANQGNSNMWMSMNPNMQANQGMNVNMNNQMNNQFSKQPIPLQQSTQLNPSIKQMNMMGPNMQGSIPMPNYQTKPQNEIGLNQFSTSPLGQPSYSQPNQTYQAPMQNQQFQMNPMQFQTQHSNSQPQPPYQPNLNANPNSQQVNKPKERFYVQLTNEERAFYSNLFERTDIEKKGKIIGRTGVEFLKKSDLSKEILKQIWYISSQTDPQCLERDEFYIALRLVALAQNNMPYTKESIIKNSPIPPLPRFNIQFNQQQQQQPTSTVSMIQLDDIEAAFALDNNDSQKYARAFSNSKEYDNKISMPKVYQMWRNANITDETIQKILRIVSPLKENGFLNMNEFIVCTHLAIKSLQKEIPNVLPKNLRSVLLNELGNDQRLIQQQQQQQLQLQQQQRQQELLRQQQIENQRKQEELLRQQQQQREQELLRQQQIENQRKQEEILRKQQQEREQEILRQQQLENQRKQEEILRQQKEQERLRLQQIENQRKQEELLKQQQLQREQEALRQQQLQREQEILRQQQLQREQEILRQQQQLREQELFRQQQIENQKKQEELLRQQQMQREQEALRQQEIENQRKQEELIRLQQQQQDILNQKQSRQEQEKEMKQIENYFTIIESLVKSIEETKERSEAQKLRIKDHHSEIKKRKENLMKISQMIPLKLNEIDISKEELIKVKDSYITLMNEKQQLESEVVKQKIKVASLREQQAIFNKAKEEEIKKNAETMKKLDNSLSRVQISDQQQQQQHQQEQSIQSPIPQQMQFEIPAVAMSPKSIPEVKVKKQVIIRESRQFTSEVIENPSDNKMVIMMSNNQIVDKSIKEPVFEPEEEFQIENNNDYEMKENYVLKENRDALRKSIHLDKSDDDINFQKGNNIEENAADIFHHDIKESEIKLDNNNNNDDAEDFDPYAEFDIKSDLEQKETNEKGTNNVKEATANVNQPSTISSNTNQFNQKQNEDTKPKPMMDTNFNFNPIVSPIHNANYPSFDQGTKVETISKTNPNDPPQNQQGKKEDFDTFTDDFNKFAIKSDNNNNNNGNNKVDFNDDWDF